MNFFQRFMSFFFVWQYVLLHHVDGDIQLKRARRLGYFWYAYPYLPHTRTKLLPEGEVEGQRYVTSWAPVTDFMFSVYKKVE